MSREEMEEYLRPSDASLSDVLSWARGGGARAEYGGHGVVEVQGSLEDLGGLLGGRFGVFEGAGGRRVTRHVGEARIPERVARHVSLVTGLSELLPLMDALLAEGGRQDPAAPRNYSGPGLAATPAFVGDLYRVPPGLKDRGVRNNRVSLAGFAANFSDEALRTYGVTFNVDASPGVDQLVGPAAPRPDNFTYETVVGGYIVPKPWRAAGEPVAVDLELQVLSGMSPGVSTWFWNMEPGKWVLEWALEVARSADPPLTHVITSSLSEFDVCSDGTGICTTSGYDTSKYIDAANTALSRLAGLGLTVVAAAGDEGNPGNNPYCPVQMGTQSMCSSVEVVYEDGDGATSCVYPAGAWRCPIVDTPDCTTALSLFFNKLAEEPYRGKRTFSKVFDPTQDTTRAGPADPDGNRAVFFTSQSTCDNLPTETAGKCTVKGYQYSRQRKPIFGPSFPGSSPYVLSVGATSFAAEEKPDIDRCRRGLCRETGASRLLRSTFTTGGGFSRNFPAPDWQQDFVLNYLSLPAVEATLPPPETFDVAKRAFPDVSALGTRCLFTRGAGSGNAFIARDGSACAAAIVGGIMSLINGVLLARGSKQGLGLPTPWLYEMAAATPEAFTDVIKGDGCCSASYCCRFCFKAAHGWDPVSGLGTLNVANIMSYLDSYGPKAQSAGWPLSRKYAHEEDTGTKVLPEHMRVTLDDVKIFLKLDLGLSYLVSFAAIAIASLVVVIRARFFTISSRGAKFMSLPDDEEED
jgi:hypothetical protein